MPSAFVADLRLQSCCDFCDSAFTSWEPEGEHLPVAEILWGVAAFNARHVVVTGGEPLIAGGIEVVVRWLVHSRRPARHR